MTDNANKPDYFQFRWGVKEWDVGFTTIPNPVLKHYTKVPWINKDGKHGCGITNQEALCIIHIASFHYESGRGEARPAISTIRKRMGYKKDDSISGLIKSLEHKNLLVVERTIGKCNVYSLRSFSQAIVDIDSPPIPAGGSIPVGDIPKDPPVPVGDHPPIPVGIKNKIKEEKPEEKKRTADPLSFDLDRQTLENKEPNYAVPPSAGGADALADSLIAIYCQHMGEALPRGSEILSCRAAINKVLTTKGLMQDGRIAKRGMEILLDPDGEYGWYHAKYTLSVGNKLFIQHYGKVLARLLADGTREPKVIKVRR